MFGENRQLWKSCLSFPQSYCSMLCKRYNSDNHHCRLLWTILRLTKTTTRDTVLSPMTNRNDVLWARAKLDDYDSDVQLHLSSPASCPTSRINRSADVWTYSEKYQTYLCISELSGRDYLRAAPNGVSACRISNWDQEERQLVRHGVPTLDEYCRGRTVDRHRMRYTICWRFEGRSMQ